MLKSFTRAGRVLRMVGKLANAGCLWQSWAVPFLGRQIRSYGRME